MICGSSSLLGVGPFSWRVYAVYTYIYINIYIYIYIWSYIYISIQGGPLPLIDRIITPLIGVITPVMQL